MFYNEKRFCFPFPTPTKRRRRLRGGKQSDRKEGGELVVGWAVREGEWKQTQSSSSAREGLIPGDLATCHHTSPRACPPPSPLPSGGRLHRGELVSQQHACAVEETRSPPRGEQCNERLRDTSLPLCPPPPTGPAAHRSRETKNRRMKKRGERPPTREKRASSWMWVVRGATSAVWLININEPAPLPPRPLGGLAGRGEEENACGARAPRRFCFLVPSPRSEERRGGGELVKGAIHVHGFKRENLDHEQATTQSLTSLPPTITTRPKGRGGGRDQSRRAGARR
jgi:hypothetical protein